MTNPAPPSILDHDARGAREVLGAWLAERGEPPFRGTQIAQQLFERRQFDPAGMTNLPAELRSALARDLLPPSVHCEERHDSVDGTRKYGFTLFDGALVESVWIPTDTRGTLCISSQAGCPAGCAFCATAAGGFRRNLRAAEIVEQWASVLMDLEGAGLPQGVTQIVFMGMGEPLLNYTEVAKALDLLTSESGFGFSPRRITVSTVGYADRMRRLLQDFPQVRLALSLHSAVDSTRSKIVPVNRKYSVETLRGVLEELHGQARRVTLEYVVLVGVNDSAIEARALADFARTTARHINLLPFHPFPGAPFAPTPARRLQRFRDEVVEAGFDGEVTIRRSRGLDIQGACGQLALHARSTRPNDSSGPSSR